MSCSLQQEQQGFYPSVSVINSLPYQQPTSSYQKPLDYQPRVLTSAFIHHKLPIQTIEPFIDIPLLQDPNWIFKESDQEGTNREQAKSPYQKYVKSCSYKLIYSKNNKTHFQNEQDFVKREIDLSCVQTYSPYNFVALKQQKYQQVREIAKDQQGLIFDSRFQCGNLLCVYQSLKQQNTYQCFVEKDTNTQGYNQWFYFSIKNMRKGIPYKFRIVNLVKKFSFLKMGMKIIVFSVEKHRKEGNGWFQRGYKIKYQSSDIFDMKYGQKVKLYCASFQLSFDYSFDFVTLSLGVPYSFSRLVKQLKTYKNNAINNDIIWHQQTLCHTVSNNQVPYLIISKKSLNATQQISQTKKSKKIIIIMARQHPGEMNSSFIMEKILQSLSLCANQKIQWLLQKYQFRVFPMVNVDGVIYGNYRCDMVGLDLNRCWKNPIPQLHPQISAIKKQVQILRKRYKIVCCIDLHSHSKQLNIFSYCNKYEQIESRVFSMILSKNCPFFNFPSCTFGLSKEKQSTARAVIGSFIKNLNALTIQSSSFGYKAQGGCVMFNDKSFQIIAQSILASLKYLFSNSKEKRIAFNQIQDNLFKLKSYCKKNSQAQSGSESDHIEEFNQLSQKLKNILPNELISIIKKRLKEQQVVSERQKQQQFSAVQVVKSQKLQTPKQNIQIKLNYYKKKPFVNNEIKNIPIKRQIQILAKKNIDKQAVIDSASYVWKPSRVSQRMKTDPKYYDQAIEMLKNQNNIRYSTPNKMATVCKTDFKHSLKMLCKELNTTNVYRQQQDGGLIINNKKEQSSEKQRYQQRNNKLQRILKVRRRTNNFKSVINRQPMIEEITILKIRSQHSQSTMEAFNPKISPTAANSKIDKFLISKQHFSNSSYVSHISFLNKFLKTNIKDTLNQKKEEQKSDF